MPLPIRVQITDTFGNRSYLYQGATGSWDMMSSGGTPLALSNIFHNEALTQFALQDAGDDPEAILAAVKQHLAYDYPAVLIGNSPKRAPERMLSDQEKADFRWMLTETIMLSNARRDDLTENEARAEFESIQRALGFLERCGADMSAQRKDLGTLNPR